jgi:hypothetical protein
MLDTDVASGQGLVAATASAGSPAAASAAPVAGGVPAGGGGEPGMMPPMGGMGGMGGMGSNQNERQPITWLQAESGTWGDDAGGDDPPAVLGRD